MFGVYAKSEKNKKPDPSFRDKATHVEKSQKPYYGDTAVVDIYELDGIYYSVDAGTGEVAEIIPDVINYEVVATYSEEQLREMAEDLVTQFLGEKLDLSQLIFSLGQKIGTYFFRWEDQTRKLDDGTTAFVQVGLSQNGDFLNFINTIPFGYKTPKVRLAIKKIPNLIGPFNQIYANGGSYWSGNSGMLSATGGYFYLYPSSYCTATYCSKFFYSSSTKSGSWFPNSNTNTRAAVFVPGTHAVGGVTYVLTDRYANVVSQYYVLQNAWYNTWVSVTSSTSQTGIARISMQNTTPNEVAWDEAWVYNP